MADSKGRSNGNLHPEKRFQVEDISQEKEPFEVGDVVGVTPKARLGVNMSPCDLLKIGWPNEFRVVDVFDHEGARHLSIYPCCNWLRSRQNNKPLCTGHLSEYFMKVTPSMVTLPSKDDRFLTVDTPWGPLISLDYLSDEQNPGLVLHFAGLKKPLALSGVLAKEIGKKAQEMGLL